MGFTVEDTATGPKQKKLSVSKPNEKKFILTRRKHYVQLICHV